MTTIRAAKLYHAERNEQIKELRHYSELVAGTPTSMRLKKVVNVLQAAIDDEVAP